MKLLLPLFLFMTSPLFATDICVRTQGDMKNLLQTSSSRIAFKNDGGMFNGGVCWWHNRLQRSSAYLVKFEPHKKMPTDPELKKILFNLRTMQDVAVIPGYSDFETFSRDYQNEIQLLLEDWQRRDGVLNFEWIRGISGKHRLPPGQMRERMDTVYNFFKKSPSPVWLMAQIKGITSHSFLLLNMQQTQVGYKLEVIDSNHPDKTLSLDYANGDTYLRNDDYTFVPYTGFQNDFKNILSTISRSCGQHPVSIDIPEGDIELRDHTQGGNFPH